MSYPRSRSSLGLHLRLSGLGIDGVSGPEPHTVDTSREESEVGRGHGAGGSQLLRAGGVAAPGEEESLPDEGVSPCRLWGDLGGLAEEE